jgi:hypothetical protein
VIEKVENTFSIFSIYSKIFLATKAMEHAEKLKQERANVIGHIQE